jgi:hypothetical protein
VSGPNCLAKSWVQSHDFHEAEVKLRAAILSYFAFKDGRPNFLERFKSALMLVRLDHVACRIINANHSMV